MIRIALSALIALLLTGSLASALESYRLGEGDVVRLTVYQRPDLTVDTRLGAGGRLYVPGGGKLDVGGLTLAEAEDQITKLLTSSGAAPRAQVDLQVMTFGSQKVSVFGYVGTPGSYALDRPTRLSDLLAQAGGILPGGSDQVILLRKGINDAVTRSVINVKDIIEDGSAAADIQVRGGDIVNVPRAPRVYVYGSVGKPGPYDLEAGMTPLQMIALAGGLSATGSDGRLEVVRHNGTGKAQSLKVGLQDRLMPEDVLIVRESIF